MKASPAQNRATWTSLLSSAAPHVTTQLKPVVDSDNPPAFFDYAVEQFLLEQESPRSSNAQFLIHENLISNAILLRSSIDPEESLFLAKEAFALDPQFPLRLLRSLTAQGMWPEEVSVDDILFILNIVERLDCGQNLSMLLLKFARHPHKKVQSKAAKIIGRYSDSVPLLEELFSSKDARVRANLVEGISRREAVGVFLPLLQRAARDSSPRVSSIALALLARDGHSASHALLMMRRKSAMRNFHASADFAMQLLDLGESLAALGSAGEVAMMPAVKEVDQQPEPHPDEQSKPVG